MFEHLCELTGKKYRTLYNMWLKSANESSYLHDFKPIDSAYLDDDDPDFQLDDEDDWDEPIGRDPDFKGEERFCWGCRKDFNTDNPGWGVDKYNKSYCPDCTTEMGDEIVKTFNENYDNPRDWSASEGEVEIMWDIDDYNDFGIYSGDTETFLIDYDLVDTHQDLVDEICKMIGKEYQDLYFEPEDFKIMNEDEFWDNRGGNPGKWEDEMYSEGEFETMADIDDNDNVVEGIPNWASCYIMYGDDSGLTPEDVAMVDKFVQDLEKDGLRLSHPISGSENEFNSYPAFGDACNTEDWSCEVV